MKLHCEDPMSILYLRLLFNYELGAQRSKANAQMMSTPRGKDAESGNAIASAWSPQKAQAAARVGLLKLVQEHIKHGAPVNMVDMHGRTLLHQAASSDRSQSTDAMRLLLQHGANVNASDRSGRTPLHAAAQSGHRSAIFLLLDAGGNCVKIDKDGKTALDYAKSLVIEYWDDRARSRVHEQSLRRDAPTADTRTNHQDLSLLIRDRVWPFYSGWLHLLLGPCTWLLESKRHEHDNVTTATIFIVCSTAPHEALCELIKSVTRECLLNLDDAHERTKIVIGQGSSSSP